MDRPRLDAVALASTGLVAGPLLALAPVPTSAAAVLVAAMARAAASGWSVALALALLAAGGVRSAWRLAAADRSYREALALAAPSARCELLADVIGSPKVLLGGAGGPIGVPDTTRPASDPEAGEPAVVAPRPVARIELSVRRGLCDGRPVPTATRLRAFGGPTDLGRGDLVRVRLDAGPVARFANPGLPDARLPIALGGGALGGRVLALTRLQRGRGPGAWIDRARAAVRDRIVASYPPGLAPMARALVLGETDLDDADRRAFQRSGLAHLLAVSGTHLVLVVLSLAHLLESVLVRLPLAARIDVRRLTALWCLPACWAYADFAGGGGSVWRAAVMLGAVMLARALGRRPDPVRCFAASMLAGAVVEPLALCDLSFSLSLGATAGLLMGRRPCLRLARAQRRPVGAIAAAMLATLAATTGCLPVLLSIGSDLPVLGVAANVLAAPVGELAALPLCLLHAASWWWPSLESGAALVSSGALAVVHAIAHAASASPLATLALPPPTPWQLATAAASMAAGWRWRGPLRFAAGGLGLGACLLLELAAVRAGAPHDELRVTVLDVGQGDAILVDLPDGSAMLVDSGGLAGSTVDIGRRVLLPVLRDRRRRRLAVVVITHPHTDHHGGLASLLESVPVGEIWHSGGDDFDRGAPLGQLLDQARARGIQVRGPETLCPLPRGFGAASVSVLGPCPQADPFDAANDASLVLRITLGKRGVLLAGDSERVAERRLLDAGRAALAADLLKVGHHGSARSSSEAFLDAALADRAPSALSVVSCGARNRFAHPAEQTLLRLRDRGVTVARTDVEGAVLWWTDGDRMAWHAHAPSGARASPP